LTSHLYKTDFADLHYYRSGTGKANMLCFHGFGMHGKQFMLLEAELGDQYTFWGFDLFFHKATTLKNNDLETVKAGLTKKALANFILGFCKEQNIDRFSVIGYSMGSHYATAIVEEVPELIDDYIVAAPSSINPGKIIKLFSQNKTGNKLIEKMALSKNGLVNLLMLLHRIRIIDAEAYAILLKEIDTYQLRFNLYASLTFLRFLITDEKRLIYSLNNFPINSIFIFGRRDKTYPLSIGKNFLPKIKNAKVLNLDESHELINESFAKVLKEVL
jgi:pimeloyl-ACP methyl ester carboxylesterase